MKYPIYASTSISVRCHHSVSMGRDEYFHCQLYEHFPCHNGKSSMVEKAAM